MKTDLILVQILTLVQGHTIPVDLDPSLLFFIMGIMGLATKRKDP